MKKYISTFVCGFGAGVASIVPILKSFTCCFIVPIAAFLSLYLDLKATRSKEKVPMKKGLLFGLFTGLYAALFATILELVITFITKQNDLVNGFPEMARMIESFPVDPQIKESVMGMIQSVRNEIVSSGFSFLYTISLVFNNTIVNSIFGMIGGLIAVQIINSRISKSEGDSLG